MRSFSMLAFTALFSILGDASNADTVFNGFRAGVDALYARTQVDVDATKPKRTALNSAESRLAQSEAAMAAASVKMDATRSTLAAMRSSLSAAEQQLAVMQQQSDVSPAVALLLAPDMAQLRTRIAQGTAALQQQTVTMEAGTAKMEAAQASLRAGQQSVASMRAFPDVSHLVMEGGSFRLSAGWGTDLPINLGPLYRGPLYLGSEVDFSPGIGQAMMRVPDRYDTTVHAPLVIGSSLKAGLVVRPWIMPYVVIGTEAQRWTVERNSTRQSYWAPALRAGAGVEIEVFDRSFVRVGYDHVFSPTLHLAGARISPSADILRVGLVRTF